MRECTICGGILRSRVTYTRKGITTTIFAHRAEDGQIHSLTDSQYTPGVPDTPLPHERISVGLRSEARR